MTILMDKIKKTPEQYSKNFGTMVTMFDEQIHGVNKFAKKLAASIYVTLVFC